MAIHHIHTYLVHPNKFPRKHRAVSGTSVPARGPLFELLAKIYNESEAECDIDITFSHANDGSQQNDCRDLIREYLSETTLAKGRKIAERLEQTTDRRSRLGLLFLITGQEGKESKIVISRFPTDVAIYVDEDPKKFTVEFLERVFMKNRTSYKAAVYKDVSLQTEFWKGRATDKQLNGRGAEASKYWIVDFLASQFTVTAAAGTRRLAKAMRSAGPKVHLGVRQEITAAAVLAKRLEGATLSIREFCDRYNLSQEASDAIMAELPSPGLAHERFTFDLVEFQRTITFKSVELSNGGVLTAPAANFDDVFDQRPMDDEDMMRFVTEGRIVNERLRAKS